MKNLSDLNGFQELNEWQKLETNGGGSLWYHIGYALGQGIKMLEDALEDDCTCTCK